MKRLLPKAAAAQASFGFQLDCGAGVTALPLFSVSDSKLLIVVVKMHLLHIQPCYSLNKGDLVSVFIL